MSEITIDPWGNIVVTINGADVVVIPKPFAKDATGKSFDLNFELDKANKVITITGDMAGAQYPVTVDPTERVTNGGFETGSTAGWYTDSNPRPTLTIVSGGADSGTYYCRYKGNLDIGIAGYSRIYQTIDYTGVTSVSMAVKVFGYNTYDFVLSDGFWQEGAGGTRNWYINFPGQVATGWVTKSATPTLTGEHKIQFWTYGYNTAGIDSISATGTVTPPAPPSYSMTNTFSQYAGKDNCDNAASALKKIGWGDPVLYHTMNEVTKTDFGVNPPPLQKTLNDATLHYHVGHGVVPYTENGKIHSGLGLLDLPNNFLSPSDVEGKWGNKNKWVILHSCYALQDERWGKALSTSHGILGFKTIINVNPEFTKRFLNYAIDKKESIYDSFKDTTYDLYKKDPVPSKTIPGTGIPDYSSPPEIPVAAVVFNNIEQAFNDHLPGIGTGVYSDTSGMVYRHQWRCDEIQR